MPWQNGPSRTAAPAWRRLRRHIITRDGNTCRNCGADGRTQPLELDHIVNVKSGGTDHPDNTQLLCAPCHKAKTQREAQAAGAARRARLKLPVEEHPGLTRQQR